ncbi:hypothetical protein BD309DRAFT_997395 [Dichomitus squalens]|nr:hypothetical protein BD309DRAFT_997395 [Dichomitus squalens]
MVEVVLPRWEDVRRRKKIQAERARDTLAGRSRLPELSDSASAPRHDSGLIEIEPEEDVKPLVALEDYDPDEVVEILHNAVQKLRHPDAKVKKELLFNDEFLLDALTWEGINHKYPIPLPKEIAECRLRREYISHLYGGNPLATTPEHGKDMLAWHGLNDWLFLTLDFNPHAPTKPGHSGLFFTSYGAPSWPGIQRTFVRVVSGRWVYMGQYTMEPGVSLSAEAWKQQKTSVRKTWVKSILSKRWGEDNCIAIWIRKRRGSDCTITAEDKEEARPMLKHIRANLTEEDISGAFDRGEEEIGTYRMRCVGYDAEFIDTLTEIQDQIKAGKLKGRAHGSGSKRKTTEVDSESEEDVEAHLKDESEDYNGPDSIIAPAPSTSTATGRPKRAAAMVKRQRTS